MSEEFVSTTCEPPAATWVSVCAENQTLLAGGLPGKAEQEKLRAEILNAAESYTAELDQAAPAELQTSGQSALVMAGHQPVIYHSGILYKNQLLQAYSGQGSGRGINVIMDLDRGQGGDFLYPVRTEAEDGSYSLRLEYAHISQGPEVFLFQSIVDRRELESQFGRVEVELGRLGFQESAARVKRALALYLPFAGASLVDANTRVRRQFEGSPNYTEVPFSKLLALAEVRGIFAGIFRDFENFAGSYNETLQAYRKLHGIKNQANPFPDLASAEGLRELPFWVIDLRRRERHPLFLARGREGVSFYANQTRLAELPDAVLENYAEMIGPDYLLAPRALVITLFFRMCAADLFIHGMGGSHYDACTDEFVRRYYRREPPRYVTATATRYLFNREAEEYERLSFLKKSKRALYFHIDKYLDLDYFDDSAKNALTALSLCKAEIIAEIKAGKAHQISTAAPTQRLKEVERQMKALIDAALDGGQAQRLDNLEGMHEAVFCREFPFFFFE